jgi:hypothetical protein
MVVLFSLNRLLIQFKAINGNIVTVDMLSRRQKLVAQVSSLTLYIPEFDATLGDIIYNNWTTGFLTDSDTGNDNLFAVLNEQAGINASNPVWQTVTDNTPVATYSALTGSGETSATAIPIARIEVTIDSVIKPPDKWYGSSDFGIYGVIQPSSSSFVDRPIWINGLQSAFPIDFFNGSDQVTYAFKPGVTATIEVFANAYQEGNAFIKYSSEGGPLTVFSFPVWDFS